MAEWLGWCFNRCLYLFKYIMRKINGSDVEVTKDDQLKINNFSKLYQKRQELDESLTKIKEKLNQHQDTLDEIEMNNDDETLRYRFGACFFYLPSNSLATQPTRSAPSSKRTCRR